MPDIRALTALSSGQLSTAFSTGLIPLAMPGGAGLADVAYGMPLSFLAPVTYTLPPATTGALGGIKVGSGLTVASDGTLTAAGTYTLPAATTSALGGVIVGTGLTVASGTLTAPGIATNASAIAAEITRAEGAEATNATAIATETTRAEAAEAACEQMAHKGVANGYAGLDGTGKVPAGNLPATSTGFSRNAYTTSGAITLTDTLSVLNSSSALAMTLANGTVDGQPMLIKNFGSGAATVTGNIDLVSGNAIALAAAASGTSSNLRDALKLRWSVADTTWIAE